MEELEFLYEIDIDEIINNIKEQLKEIDAFEIIHYSVFDDELILNLGFAFNINNTYNTYSLNFGIIRISAEKIIDHVKSFLKIYHNYNLDDELHRIITLKNNINTLEKL